MANRINLKIDVSKITKEKLKQNTFQSKDGEVNQLNALFVLVEKKEPKLIASGTKENGDEWELYETHFIAEKSSKDEETNYVGVGTQFRDKNAPTSNFDASNGVSSQTASTLQQERENHNNPTAPSNYPSDEIDPSEIPF